MIKFNIKYVDNKIRYINNTIVYKEYWYTEKCIFNIFKKGDIIAAITKDDKFEVSYQYKHIFTKKFIEYFKRKEKLKKIFV